jgi:mitochondrial enoyl-[acyl-carrier protein] reductase / trans-2-enoyl-CoA reductase
MKSRRLVFASHGKPLEVLELEETELPALASGEVLLEILAAPVNPADLNFIEGNYGVKPTLPAHPGMECCARVLESRAGKFKAGDLVFPLSRIGAWSSHAVTNAENLISLPPAIDPLQGAMLKVNPATAWLLLHDFTRLHPGDWIALNAANSGVGQCVIQLAAELGIRTICFLRRQEQGPELEALGATKVFADTPDGLAAARAALGPDHAKLAFNAVGGDSAGRLLKLLGDGGTHITYGAMARKPLTIANGPLIFKDLRLRGLWVTNWIEHADQEAIQNLYASLAGRLTTGSLSQKIDSTHRLSDFRQALKRLHAAERNGKILLAEKSSAN